MIDGRNFEIHYKLIAIDLSKQHKLDYNPKAILKINFTGNLGRDGNTQMVFISEEAIKTVLDFSQGAVKLL